LLVGVLLALPLLQPVSALASTLESDRMEAGQDNSTADETPQETEDSASPTTVTPWWELHPKPSSGWKFGLLRQADRHARSWAIPVAIVGGIGLLNVGVGIGVEVLSNSFFGDPVFLVTGIGSVAVAAAMAGAAFPSLSSIKRVIGRYDDPGKLHQRLRRTRLVLGGISIGTGLCGLGLGLLAPLTFGITGIPAAILTAGGVMLGHASLTFLIFEQEVTRFVKEKGKLRRFSRLPRNPAPPQLVEVSPMGLRFVF